MYSGIPVRQAAEHGCGGSHVAKALEGLDALSLDIPGQAQDDQVPGFFPWSGFKGGLFGYGGNPVFVLQKRREGVPFLVVFLYYTYFSHKDIL